MSDLINAVKRLDRAGTEHSQATKKLHQAASTVADFIESCVPAGVELPRGYMVRTIKSSVGYGTFLLYRADEYGDAEYWIDGEGGFLHGDFHCSIPAQTRAGSLQFAQDVATGLLDEIAEFLEKRASEAESHAEVLLATEHAE